MVRHAFSIDLPEEISGRCAGREPRLVEMEEQREIPNSELSMSHADGTASSQMSGMLHIIRISSLSPFFSL